VIGSSSTELGPLVLHELRIIRRDPIPYAVLVTLPLFLMAFTKGAFQAYLVAQGYPNATGAEQVMTVTFAMFLLANVGFAFFREYEWMTWDRLRVTAATPFELLSGKAIPGVVILIAQIGILFGVGAVLFDLHVSGSILALIITALVLAFWLSGLAVALAMVCRTSVQMNAAANMSTLLLAGIGGALTPFHSLPGWAQAVAPVTPTYWSMKAFLAVILRGAALGDIAGSLAAMAAFGVAFAIFALVRFRHDWATPR
jgi:ABC-2 type transport system permease protein